MMDRAVYRCKLPAHIHHSIIHFYFHPNELIHDELEEAFRESIKPTRSHFQPTGDVDPPLSRSSYRKIDSFTDED